MDGHLQPGNPLHWKVPVLDAFGRERELGIGARDGRVVFVTPPGGGFSMTSDNADYCSAAVKAAGERAAMQR